MIASFLLSFFGFLLTVAILVTVHEFGHYWVACRAGVNVVRFSIGFGKPLFRWVNRVGTEFVVAAVPLGGYVKMLDERIMPVPPDLTKFAFNTQSVEKRIAVVSAGPLANFMFAVLVYWVLYAVGIPALKPVIGGVEKGSVAEEAGFRKGDEIIWLAGERTPTWSRVESLLLQYYRKPDRVTFRVKRVDSGTEVNLDLSLPEGKEGEQSLDLLGPLGISRYLPPIPAVVGDVLRNSPAERSGLQAGDKIVLMDSLPVADWTEAVSYIQTHPQKIIQLSLIREGRAIRTDLIPERKVAPDGKEIGFVGAIHAPINWPEEMKVSERYSIPTALFIALDKTWEVSTLSLRLLYLTLVGEVPRKVVGGPISIAKGAGASMDAGVISFLNFLALLSIGLGLLNILPIPLLDGGHLFFYLIEAVRRKPVPESIQNIGIRIGFALLVAITILALYNDLS